MALLHDIHLTENEEGYQFKAIDPTSGLLALPLAMGLFNLITADPLRTLPFALLFSKDQPDQKGFQGLHNPLRFCAHAPVSPECSMSSQKLNK